MAPASSHYVCAPTTHDREEAPSMNQAESPHTDPPTDVPHASGYGYSPLPREEYVEQAHFFAVLVRRLRENQPAQEVLSLGYPKVPRPKAPAHHHHLLPALARRIEQLEMRLKLVEEEQRGGIDLQRFYFPPDPT